MKSHLSVHIARGGTLTLVLQPRLSDGTFTHPVPIARPVPATSHIADYTAPTLRVTRSRLRK